MHNSLAIPLINNKWTITYHKEFIQRYVELTQPERDQEDFERPENKTVINPLAGKLIFGSVSDYEKDSLAFIKDSVQNYNKTIVELFMFVDLKLFADLYGSSRVKRDVAIGRGDFDFISELVEGVNTRNVDEVENFAMCIWFDGQATEEFIRTFRDMETRIKNLKAFYKAQKSKQSYYNSIR